MRSWLGLAVILFLLPALPAVAQTAACGDAVGRDFVAASPAEAGLSATRLLQLTEALDAGAYDLRGLLVLRDCRLVYERYKSSVRRDFNHAVYSVTKSVTSTLAGALLHQGRLPGLDLAAAAIVPRPEQIDDAAWAKAGRITLRHVMQMASGLDYSHDPTRNPIYSLRIDRFAHALQPDPVAAPGTRFLYSDGDVSITGAIVSSAAGATLHDTARSLLFGPLQMVNHDWWYMDRAGRHPGGWGLRLRPMDMLKLGQLYLQDCIWNGRRICAAGYVQQAWTPGPSSAYGLHWWVGRAGSHALFSARGFKGQRILVVPELRLVAAMTATLTGAEERAVDGLLLAATAELTRPDPAADAATAAQLADLQKTGFRGTTRAVTEDQDTPRR